MVGTIICTESRFYILRDWLSHYLITSSVFIFSGYIPKMFMQLFLKP
ncbi:hypothetical protein APHCR_0014 [Anaplasma phagocytophilum str. CR1007]|nr:hypothetical protein APHCR_0014 [Anaplasma phagocytophilum str. CR1007]